MPKKLLFFCGGSYVAGMEIITLLLMKGLKNNGYDVRCVVNGWNDGDFKKRLSEIDVPYYEVKLGWLYWRKPAWTVGTLVNYPKAYRTCKKALKDFEPDIINFTNYGIPVMLYPLIRGNSFYTLHDTQLPNLKHRIIYKLLNRKIKKFIAVSNHIADTLKNLSIPGEKITTIYNGIVAPGVSPVSQTAGSGDTLCFAIIGQVTESKGHSVLIDAAASLVKKGITNFKIVIVGNNNNDYSKALVEMIEEKKITPFFTWKGFIRNTEEIYNGVDVVIIPSLCIEAFSLTTAETMIRSLAPIASNRGGMKELIDHGETGLLFNPGDAGELSECMARLIQDRNYIQYLGNNAKKKAMANFTQQVMTQKYMETYNNVCC